MSSKLVKQHGFGRKVNMRVELPYAADQVRAVIAVMLMPDGTVNLSGPLKNESLSMQMMEAGIKSLEKYHRQRRAKLSGGLVGLDGEPIRRDS